ncbi:MULTISPECIES: dTDP-4-dehydrorhamnose reductase [unclassified Flavobacterium]|jgi:dTDP-4-dehydrorhamnose reductase|uniref:dTDP-4-dehydrorhamnose reductase n=1 Tax=Flavobacterium sp. I-STPP5a TaxID=2590449 RepID=UPI0018EECD65|nr:dTDP-4-dehydrorhamnose reductase [Flavobacterium sp. I-STPP5a]
MRLVVLVTGANGQVGQSIQFIADNYPQIDFVFCDSKSLDITESSSIEAVFKEIKPDFCVNTAAYTAVDQAESQVEQAFAINASGAKNLAKACATFKTILIHISTDFIFDGQSQTPYTEVSFPNPQSIYGQSKLDGEIAIQECLKDYFIVRTSWVYSQFGSNFKKSMLRLATEREQLSVVNDQIGTPTNAVDLAEVVVHIILYTVENPEKNRFGVYHFSNEGQCSWFEFAQKIFEVNSVSIALNPIPSSSYPTPAQRPKYSVLDKSKIKKAFNITIKTWDKAL